MFDDYILSLSLGSDIVMDFRKENIQNSILLKSKSLLIMSGESRYDWNHGITPRKFDIINTVDGPDIMCRGTRISVTFRRVTRSYKNIDVNRILLLIIDYSNELNCLNISDLMVFLKKLRIKLKIY